MKNFELILASHIGLRSIILFLFLSTSNIAYLSKLKRHSILISSETSMKKWTRFAKSLLSSIQLKFLLLHITCTKCERTLTGAFYSLYIFTLFTHIHKTWLICFGFPLFFSTSWMDYIICYWCILWLGFSPFNGTKLHYNVYPEWYTHQFGSDRTFAVHIFRGIQSPSSSVRVTLPCSLFLSVPERDSE